MKQIVLLITVLTTLYSCQKDAVSGNQGDEPQAPVQLWPLKVGNTWTYQGTDYKQDGSVDATYTYSMTISDTVSYGSHLYYIMKTEGIPGANDLIVRSEETEAFFYILDWQNEFRVVKWPASEGEVLYSHQDDSSLDSTVMGSVQPIDINNFKSYSYISKHYERFGGGVTDSSLTYFKPEVGVTGTIAYKPDSAHAYFKDEETKLLSYELK
jgi:hypothetical protein